MNKNIFFQKKNIKLKKIFPHVKNNFLINDIKPLHLAKKFDISFFDSIKYKDDAIKTKAGACITTLKLEKFISSNSQKIIVKNVLFELANALKNIYPFADIDYPDLSLKSVKSIKKFLLCALFSSYKLYVVYQKNIAIEPERIPKLFCFPGPY